MTQIAYSGLFWTQFRVSRDSFTDLTAGKATVRTFLPRLLTTASQIKNCSYRKNNYVPNSPVELAHFLAPTRLESWHPWCPKATWTNTTRIAKSTALKRGTSRKRHKLGYGRIVVVMLVNTFMVSLFWPFSYLQFPPSILKFPPPPPFIF